MRIDKAISELFAGIVRLVRYVGVSLGAERRAVRRVEFQRLLEFGHAHGLDAEALAEIAEATGDRRAAKALRRMDRKRMRLALRP